MFSDGHVLRWVRSGVDKDGTWILLDNSGDGLPDSKASLTGHERIVEEAQTTFKRIEARSFEDLGRKN